MEKAAESKTWSKTLKPANTRSLLACAYSLIAALGMSLPVLGQSDKPTGIEASLPTIRQMNDPGVLMNVLQGAAMQNMQAGNVERAIKFIDESISIARKMDDPRAIDAPLMIATQILNRTSPERASKFLVGVLNAEAGKPEVEAIILQRLGEHLQRSGDIVAAIQVLHDFQLKCKQQDPASELTARALLQYGQACLNGKMFDLAQPALLECKKVSDSLGRNDLIALCDASLANACLGTEQYDTAAGLFLSQLENAKKANDKNSAFAAVTGLVTALIGSGKLDDAATVLENNLADSEGMLRGELLALNSTLATLNDDSAVALESSQAAEESRLKDIPFIARMMVSASAVMNDKIAQAFLHYELGDFESCYKAAGDAEKGYFQIRQQVERAAKVGAVNLDSSLTGYSALLASISSIRQQVLVQQNKTEDALVEAEAGRGQVQLQAMQRLFGAPASKLDDTGISLDAIRDLAKKTRATFVEYSIVEPIDYLTRSRMGKSSTKFPAREVFVWVVKPTGQIHFEKLTFDDSVASIVSSLRNEIAPPRDTVPAKPESDDEEDRQQDEREAEAEDKEEMSIVFQRQVFDLLWKPIQPHLPKNPEATVVIVPHGELFAIPFSALLNEQSQPIVQLHTTVTAGSIALYQMALNRRQQNKAYDVQKVLVVGNPEMPNYRYRPDKAPSPLSPLPGSEREAKAIAGMFGIEALTGKDATESDVKQRMRTAPVIHMATHGLLEADSVFTRNYLSSMALSTDEKSDGFLTVREVMDMQLDAELAVLSACDSGRGKITGDGVVGLSRAYLTAGVPNVVVSLWPVSDQATAFMMVQFYKALGSGQSKAAALRNAILATRQQTTNPRLWAPFVLYGFGN